MIQPLDRRLSVAPMMEWTDRHERYFLRLLTRRTLLYTEMVTAAAVLHGDSGRLLAFDPSEHPVALQVGGSVPDELARCAEMGQALGYDEVNLNVGCPSDRVQSGRFGACLMAEPDLVGRCVASMRAACDVPVTVKCRIGIDDRDSYEDLSCFVETVAAAGCPVFIVHARKAWLCGLSPKQNREVPELRHDWVYRLKEAFPDLAVVLNGGVRTLEQARGHLARVDGVMIGREAYENPYLLADADRRLWGDEGRGPSRAEAVERFLPYVRSQMGHGVPLAHMARHLAGLYRGRRGSKDWRRFLAAIPARGIADLSPLIAALEMVRNLAGEEAPP